MTRDNINPARGADRVRRILMAGTAVAGLVLVGVAQTAVPSKVAIAEPVRIETPAPANFSAVVKAVSPAVVSVRVRKNIEQGAGHDLRGGDWRDGIPGFEDLPEDHPMRRFFRRFGAPDEYGQPRRKRGRPFVEGQGSGFFVSEDGFVVTNHHVVADGARFSIITQDGTEYNAELIGSDARTDLAVLKVTAEEKFTHVAFAENVPEVGEWVIAVGNPFGLGGSVTAGIVSARGRDIGAGPYDDFLQIDAPVNRGNSGGPTFNVNGEVVGVNTAIFSPSGGNVGIAFAISSELAEEVVADLQDDGQIIRGWLGVQIQPIGEDIAARLSLPDGNGALVVETQPNSPALAAGLKVGDAIRAVDGAVVEGPRALSRLIAGKPPGETVALAVWRNGTELDISVDIGELPSTTVLASAAPNDQGAMLGELGLTLANRPASAAAGDGVVVTNVDPDSPAAEKALRPGDVIVSVAGRAVKRVSDVRRALRSVAEDGRKAVLLRVRSGEATRFIALPFGQA